MKITEEAACRLSELFEGRYGIAPQSIQALAASGGDRRYYRLSANDVTAIGVHGNNLIENDRFIYVDSCLRAAGASVPEVYCVSDDGHYYLQQDLGSTSLFDMISNAGEDEQRALVERCMRALPGVQCAEMDYARLYAPFGVRMIMRDLNYFRYCMLKPSGVDPDEDLIDEDFYAMAERLAHQAEEYVGFMYRDCQSRNVMMVGDEPYWIDFQGGRRGPVLYDVASFLWQARAGFSAELRQAGVDAYIDEYCRQRPEADGAEMRRMLPQFVLLRLLQVMGAYGFRGLIEHRAHFILSIGPAIRNLSELLQGGTCEEYPELKRCLTRLVEIWDERLRNEDLEGRLTVKVFSFSYKKGYPADYSGNGGGFMFDCRGMHNPGRYEQYKRLTGRDKPVIDFLEERGEVQEFVRNAAALVEPSVAAYIRRGFSSLQIGFGCTGGQHRSVYCAEVLAKKIKADFPDANVVLSHREQGISETL